MAATLCRASEAEALTADRLDLGDCGLHLRPMSGERGLPFGPMSGLSPGNFGMTELAFAIFLEPLSIV